MTAVRESGDRHAFLGRLRRRLASGIPPDPAHPVPPPADPLPEAVPDTLVTDDLLGSFVHAAAAVHTEVHRVRPADVDTAVAEIVGRHRIRTVAVSPEPPAAALRRTFEVRGVEVVAADRAAVASADAGVTGAVAGIAATGTVVVSAAATTSRGLWLLPPTHVVVLAADAVVATPADFLRTLDAAAPLPSNLCLVTGPSRSGDIEQIIVEGVHGPTAVHVLLLAPDTSPIPPRTGPSELDDPRCTNPEGEP